MVVGGACIGYDEKRSMSRRYASYSNAFLYCDEICRSISSQNSHANFKLNKVQGKIFFIYAKHILLEVNIPLHLPYNNEKMDSTDKGSSGFSKYLSVGTKHHIKVLCLFPKDHFLVVVKVHSYVMFSQC